MAKVIVYTSTHCPYCRRAEALLNEKNVSYDRINVDEDDGAREKMVALTGRRTVPQIIINGEPIGGSDDLYALDRAGKLDALLAS